MTQSKRDKLICDKTIEYFIKNYGEIRTVCPAGYAGLSDEVLEMAGCSLKRVEDFSRYGILKEKADLSVFSLDLFQVLWYN